MIDGVFWALFSQQSKVTFQVALWVRQDFHFVSPDWGQETQRKWIPEVLKQWAIEFASRVALWPHSLEEWFLHQEHSACRPVAADWNASEWQWAMEAIAAHYKDAKIMFACGSKLEVDSVAGQVTKEWMFNSKTYQTCIVPIWLQVQSKATCQRVALFSIEAANCSIQALWTQQNVNPVGAKLNMNPNDWGQRRNYIIISYHHLSKKCIVSALTGCVFLHGT